MSAKPGFDWTKLITVALAAVTLFASVWLSVKLTEARLDRAEADVAALSARLEAHKKLPAHAGVDNRVVRIEARIDALESSQLETAAKLDAIRLDVAAICASTRCSRFRDGQR